MMSICFPGTVVKRNGRNVQEFLFGIFSVTKGLMLAQVREITGLDTSAIQNWVNRGWVAKPIDKRYGMDHLARIMIINMLRDVMKLENINTLLTYINGETENRQDDVIAESRLYTYLCDILDNVDYDTILSPSLFEEAIDKAISDYVEPFFGARQRLNKGLQIILTYYACTLVKWRADKIFEDVVGK